MYNQVHTPCKKNNKKIRRLYNNLLFCNNKDVRKKMRWLDEYTL